MKSRLIWVVGGVACIAVIATLGVAIEAALGARERSVSSIVAEWSPSVADVACNYLNPDGTMLQTTASGAFLREGTQDYVLTSVHALAEGNDSPVSCDVEFPNAAALTVLSGNISTDPSSFDVEELKLPDGGATPKGLVSVDTRVCRNPQVGDEIVMLGYPFADTTGLVAVENIIGGDADDRYYTASIRDGESGGVAIDRSGDCYLGMTSSALPIQSENLGQIVKWSSMRLP